MSVLTFGAFDDVVVNDNYITKHGHCMLEGIRTGKYCRGIGSGDIITMRLDLVDNCLSFGIGDEWYGKAMDISGFCEENVDCRLCIGARGYGICADIIQYTSNLTLTAE